MAPSAPVRRRSFDVVGVQSVAAPATSMSRISTSTTELTMGRGNTLAGAEKTKRPSFTCSERLLDAFDEWVEQSDHGSRSEALKSLMKDAVAGGVSHDTPREPPAEEPLRTGYQKLVNAANADGWIRHDQAVIILSSNGIGVTKKTASGQVIKPLCRRGYLRRSCNIEGDTSYRIRPGRE
jgi:hypothetical protein